ncbi:MAG TPA: enoyl-CoA hydratase-related protein, partial [Candidatus Binataceae bacterium]|nr:enoyl-CoA hydratase-related protein [Candidatus Binataceae bacterium]
RPAKLNAFTTRMGAEIIAAFRDADADSNVRAIIFTGAGRAFCAGADIVGFVDDIKARETGGSRNENREGMLAFPALMRTLRKPSIVAINGYAIGVGATMTLPCDIRIMAEEAKIGFVFARVGLMPELGSSYYLPRLIGASRASEMMMTGRNYDAAECLSVGLVSQVAPAAELIARARALADEVIKGAPTSLALTRRAIQVGLGSTLESAIEFEMFALEKCAGSAEHKEYVSAFIEKRPPDLGRLKR